jgi:DNA helicase-2/ATP-dependent DNA helicase PcrA
MPWNDGLTGTPLAIAGYDGTPLHVLAGPGTGKTYALMRRVARFIEQGVGPSRILAVTFTRIASNDLLVNLHQLGVQGCEDVKATTLHSLCFHILSKNEVLQITGRTPRPLLKHEIDTLLQDLPGHFGGKKAKKELLDSFTSAWARLQTDEPGWPPTVRDREFQAQLLAWLRFHKAVLVGELVPLTLSYLRNNPACPERTLFDVVLADEYQDLNKAEQTLIDLFSANGRLTVVGDDDQSIYQFMKHAHPEGIIDFPANHANTDSQTLDECRRCPTLIVEMADALVQHNTTRSNRHLLPRATNQRGIVSIVQWDDIEQEAQGVSTFVGYCLDTLRVPEKEVIVLCPRRLLGYQIRDFLKQSGKRVRSCFTEDALDGDHAKRQFVLFNLLAHSDDLPALRAWFGLGRQNKRAPAYSRLRTYCDRNSLSPFDVLPRLSNSELRIAYSDQLVDLWNELQAVLATLRGLTTTQVVDALFPEGDFDLEELRSLSLAILPGMGDLSELFDSVKAQIAHPELPQIEDSVRVMSLHKSKGLTARAVVVAGCIEGWLPLIDGDLNRVQQHRQLEEARRLFFVALTRTTEVALISSCLYMDYRMAGRTGAEFTSAGAMARTQSSRFLGELGRSAPRPMKGEDLLRQLGLAE